MNISRIAVAPLSPYGPPNNARCSANQISGLCSSSQPRRVQSTTFSARSTQHMWWLLAGMRTAVLPRHYGGKASYGYAMLMSPNKGETAVRGCHCQGAIDVCMREEVLARPWVSVCVPLAFSFSYIQDAKPHNSITRERNSFQRIFVSLGAITAGLFILMAGYIESPSMVIVCMSFAGAAAGIVYAGFQVNMLDIAPRNASIVMGIANATANTAGFLSPMLVGFITHNKVSFF